MSADLRWKDKNWEMFYRSSTETSWVLTNIYNWSFGLPNNSLLKYK